MITNLLPSSLTLLAAPGESGCVQIPSQGRAVVTYAAQADLPPLDLGVTQIPVTSCAEPAGITGLPDTATGVVVIPAIVADAMRKLGWKRLYRLMSPQLLKGAQPNQWAPGLVEHLDLFGEG